MDAKCVVSELEKHYPGKKIVLNDPTKPTEIICEIDPSDAHPDFSVAIAVIDESVEHVHRETTEIYEVIKGTLTITRNGEEFTINQGESFVVHPNEMHKAVGNETWIKVTSEPGWSDKDHVPTQ